ncbi:hypothetical protein Vretifemale_17771 [Volvox reticuliferus]|nr:hypothetical protein Vretifemale_17771 [Volvox reticuliferus]
MFDTLNSCCYRDASEAPDDFCERMAQSSGGDIVASINARASIDEAGTPVQACATRAPFCCNENIDVAATPRTPADQIPFDARGATPDAPLPAQTVARTLPAPSTSEPPSPYGPNIVRNLEPVLMAIATATTIADDSDVCGEVCANVGADVGGEEDGGYDDDSRVWPNGYITGGGAFDPSFLMQGSPAEPLLDGILTPLPVLASLPISTPLAVSTPPLVAVPQDSISPQLISTPQPKTATAEFKSECLLEGLAASPTWVAPTVPRKAPTDIDETHAGSALMLSPLTLVTQPAIESGGIDAVNSVEAAAVWREIAAHVCDTPIAFPAAVGAVEVAATGSVDVAPTLEKVDLTYRLPLHTNVQEVERVDEAEDCGAVDAAEPLALKMMQSSNSITSAGCNSQFRVLTVELPAVQNSAGPDGMDTGDAKDVAPSGSPLLALSQGGEEEDAEYCEEEASKRVETANAMAALKDPSFAVESVAQHDQHQEQPHSPPTEFRPICDPSSQKLVQDSPKSEAAVAANPVRAPARADRKARAAKGRLTPSPKHQTHLQVRLPGGASARKGATTAATTAATTSAATPRIVASNPKLKRAIISSPTGSAGNATPATARRPVGPDPEEGARSPRFGRGDKRSVVRRLNTTSPQTDVYRTAVSAAIRAGDGSTNPCVETGAHNDSGVMPRYAAPTVASIARQATISPPQLQQHLRLASSSKLSLTTVMAHIGAESVRGSGTIATSDGSSRRSALESRLQASVSSSALVP